MHRSVRRATSLIHISEIKIVHNLPSIILVLIFVYVNTLIMLMLFLEQARGRRTASHMVLAGDLQWWDSAGSHRFYRTVSRNFMRSANRLALLVTFNGFLHRI